MRKLPPLSALRAFEATARHLSMKRAADELSVTPTAISHQIRRLEDALGVALFERQVRALRLSEAGERLYPVLNTGFDAFAQAIDAIRTPEAQPLRQRVTLTAPLGLAARCLVPRLGNSPRGIRRSTCASTRPTRWSTCMAAAPTWPCDMAIRPSSVARSSPSTCLTTPTRPSAIRV